MIGFLLFAMTILPSEQPREPLSLYHRGSYRQVVSALLTKTNRTFEENYILAQSLLMVENHEKAWSVASQLSFEHKDVLSQFLLSFLVQKLLEKPLSTNTNLVLSLTTNWLLLAKHNPFFSTNLIENLFWQSWMLDPSLSPPKEYPFLTTSYQAWKQFLEKEPSSLPLLLSNRILLIITWPVFTNRLEILSNLPPSSLPLLWSYLSRLPSTTRTRLAESYLPSLPHSRKWIAEVEYAVASKELSKAISIIEKALSSSLVSLEDYQKALSWANQLKAYSLAEKIAGSGIQKFGSVFHFEYARSLFRQGKNEMLLSWYEANESSIINRDVALFAFRLLVEKKDPRLLSWLVRREEKTPHQTFLLARALLLLENLQTAEAYPLFLRILSDYPYTYEWWVAQEYATPLHHLYPHVFSNWYKEATNALPSLSLQPRLLRSLALADITGEMPSAATFTNDLKQYQQGFFSTHFFLTPEQRLLFDRLLSLSNTPWTNYPRELCAYLDRELSTPENRYRFAWYGYELYEKADAIGIALSRLDFAVRRYTGRDGIVLLPSEWQRRLFPLSPLVDIRPSFSNTNHALWVLSAYRQESHFRKDVVSLAGAYGYAQLMPKTAHQLAKNLKKPELSPYDYDDNLLLGNSFYTYLFRRYNWIPFALAAYNAGEGAVNTWRKRYSFRSPLWIECIPYEETRNYVKVIWQNVAFYRRIYPEYFASIPFSLD
ncbi:MAG: lytic transglycosylase domain-containing protein [Brevinematales bacterium]|nr:lytic transglycosylase domain-containing protein [Brevinematales bacterium]